VDTANYVFQKILFVLLYKGNNLGNLGFCHPILLQLYKRKDYNVYVQVYV
jgi:hypothetical protein